MKHKDTLFELYGPNGEEWLIRANGSCEGFPAGTVVLNEWPLLKRQLFAAGRTELRPFKNGDRVRVALPIPDCDVPVGTKGTIVGDAHRVDASRPGVGGEDFQCEVVLDGTYPGAFLPVRRYLTAGTGSIEHIDPLEEIAGLAAAAFKDAQACVVGSPALSPIAWRFLNLLGDALQKVGLL